MFKSELEKFRTHQNRLVQANHKQSALLKELTAAFNSLLQDKRVHAEQSKYESIQRQRSSVVNKYKRAYQEFLDLEAGLQSAKRWYSEMKETVESLEKNVEAFVNNRRSEGAQLLNQIEQDRAANKGAQAEFERDRLRGLMERMSLEKSTPSSPKHSGTPSTSVSTSANGRSIPASLYLSSATTPQYSQPQYPSQYQIPTSPPANQGAMPSPYATQFGQQTYNPSAHGRIPGPASPPPTVTSFGVNAMRPVGPTSPPPTQTTFGQPGNQYSTYGNQQAVGQTPHSAVGPGFGFVPPPPPRGPPPLGPQQTYHVGQSDYYSQQQQQQQPSASQGDPWAGLNNWK